MKIPDNLTIADAARELREGGLTAEALTRHVLDRTRALNPQLGAYVEVTEALALEQAAAADVDFAAGRDRGPLQGIPLAIKDIIAVRGVATTANSHVLDPRWGEGTEAPVATRLRNAGAVFVGKSTTSEFALGMPDPEKRFLIPRNPWDLDRTPAGSSSGTGIAVAAGLALGGLGTDTGGSVRGPASLNGHTGLKVTFGRVPKSGVVPLGYSLDTVGPMARSAYDCAAILEVIAGFDASDPNAADVPGGDYRAALDGDVTGVRIGVPVPYFFDHPLLDDEVRAAVLKGIDVLVGLGAQRFDTEVPNARLAKDATHLLMMAEAYAYHRDDLVGRWSDYGRSTRAQLARGAMLNGADVVQAHRFRRQFATDVATLLSRYDVLIVPTSARPAQLAGELNPSQRLHEPAYTGQWNLAGLPAIAVPAGFSSGGLPLSMQIVGKPFGEATVLKVADAFQRSTRHHLATPPVDHLLAAAA